MNKEAMYDLKWNYNRNLSRYYNGCKYCEKHRDEIDKWMPELLSILENIDILFNEISQYEVVNDKEKFEGFEI